MGEYGVLAEYLLSFYMKYPANQKRISSFAKIFNFVRQARATDQICLMAVSY